MRDTRYSGTYGRVLIVLALGILASLFVPLTCWGQAATTQGRAVAGSNGHAAINCRSIGPLLGGSGSTPFCRETDFTPAPGHAFHQLRGALRSTSNIAPNAPKIKPDGTQFSPRLLAIPVAAVWGASVYTLGAFGQVHHEYYGAALLLSNRKWVQWAGLAIMVDDAAQHLIQTRHPAYRSPLHQAYAVTLYRWFR